MSKQLLKLSPVTEQALGDLTVGRNDSPALALVSASTAPTVSRPAPKPRGLEHGPR